MDVVDDSIGEILVLRDGQRARVAMHIRGITLEEYRVVQLSRQEARRLAALLLYQAERLADVRLRAAGDGDDTDGAELNCA